MQPHQMIKIKQTYVFSMFFYESTESSCRFLVAPLLSSVYWKYFLNKAHVFFHHVQECKSILFILGDSSHLCAAECSKNGNK